MESQFALQKAMPEGPTTILFDTRLIRSKRERFPVSCLDIPTRPRIEPNVKQQKENDSLKAYKCMIHPLINFYRSFFDLIMSDILQIP